MLTKTPTIKYPPGSYLFDDRLFLLSLKDLDDAYVLKYVSSAQLSALYQIKDWVYHYLMRPHEKIGRLGPVCPYVPKAVQEDSLFLTVISPDRFEKNSFYEMILNYFDWFTQLAPAFGQKHIFRSIIMLVDLPNTDNHQVVDQAVIDLKSHFVERKSMLGEFHSAPPRKGGIRNPDFRPLMSPVPLLAIREMVETDIAFLKENPADLGHYQQFFHRKKPNTLHP